MRMITLLSPRALLFALFVALSSIVPCAFAQNTPAPAMTLVVDETQAARRIASVHEEFQVAPGSLALAYPLWIPGEHGPTGPVEQFAALRIRSGNAALAWTRDPENISTIHVEIPANTDRISVDFDTLLENTISDHQLLLAWNTVVLYPRGIDKRQLMIEPSVLLPANWQQGSSVLVTSRTGNRVNFASVSLERLIDSPMLAGEFFRVAPLASAWPAELDITGDSQSAVDKADDAHAFNLFEQLMEQGRAMFGFRHWKTLHILISQSDARPFDGLEHEDSPYEAVGDAALSKKDQLQKFGWVLYAHELTHSWDGKYRRPAELYSKTDYQGPERSSLLWVYEGLNEYIGMLLGTRAGFNDAAYMRDYLGRSAADFSMEPGRASTPLVDTATENWVLRTPDIAWSSLRRGQDYYDEGALIWLRADVQIREQTKGRLSLDDFLRNFFGQRDTDPIVAPYTREDVEAALSAICPFDWHTFFETHVYQVNSKPPTDGLEAAGWRLVYNATPNNERFDSDTLPIGYDGAYSIGMYLKKDGTIIDVLPGTPAYDAGLGPHMTLLAVDGRVYSDEALNESIAHPRNGKIPLIVRNFDSVESREIQYAGGVRYPHLERIPGSHDYLTEILEPRSYKDH
jgi:predicted metalloprotease with PDZ domain